MGHLATRLTSPASRREPSSPATALKTLEILHALKAIELLRQVDDVFASPRDGQHALGPLESWRKRRARHRPAGEAVFHQLEADPFFAERLPELRRLPGVEFAEAHDDHVTDAGEAPLEIVDQHVLDGFTHGE